MWNNMFIFTSKPLLGLKNPITTNLMITPGILQGPNMTMLIHKCFVDACFLLDSMYAYTVSIFGCIASVPCLSFFASAYTRLRKILFFSLYLTNACPAMPPFSSSPRKNFFFLTPAWITLNLHRGRSLLSNNTLKYTQVPPWSFTPHPHTQWLYKRIKNILEWLFCVFFCGCSETQVCSRVHLARWIMAVCLLRGHLRCKKNKTKHCICDSFRFHVKG